ncbi:MAG: T9SS type A sorting domain-containing protein [Saprospiraceae bacterium]|nr:T9SS type A sorting domain-containing protein [Saprospiraceae bacterium]
MLLSLNIAISQNQICGFSVPESSLPVEDDYSNLSFNLPVRFYFIRDANCNGGEPLSVMSTYMNELNSVYSSAGISFYQLCHVEVCEEKWTNAFALDSTVGINEFAQKYLSMDAINIILSYSDGGNYYGYAWPGFNTCRVIPLASTPKNNLSHEVGHVLTLLHTEEVFNGMSCFNDPNSLINKGDLVEDTPPDPGWLNLYRTNCQWDSTKCTCRDPCHDEYQGTFDFGIMMSGYWSCTEYFTIGQANRMKNKLVNGQDQHSLTELQTDWVITTYTALNSIKRVNRDIIIKNGGTLEVFSTLFMPEKAKIIVEPGGILKVSGGKITLGAVRPTCEQRAGLPKFWYGIEMQTSSGQSIPKFYCNNGTIELSELGLHNKTGMTGPMIAEIHGSTFKNNKHSVYLRRSAFVSLPINISGTRFFLSKSTSNGALPFPLANYHSQVYTDNSNIQIAKCTFDNPSQPYKHQPLDNKSYSVRVMNCILNITGESGANGIKTVFKDSLYGVSVSSIGSAKLFKASNCKFDKTQVGIKVDAGVNNYSVTNNEFINCIHRGLISNRCTGYSISKNKINNTSQPSAGFIGMEIIESGPAENVIDSNTLITSNRIGIHTFGDNGNNEGLLFKCNYFDLNSNDIKIDGSNSPVQGSLQSAIGNRVLSPFELDLNVNLMLHEINYFHRNFTEETPESHMLINTTIVSNLTCGVPRSKNDTINRNDKHKIPSDTLNDLRQVYNNNIDDGSTSDLIDIVIDATSSNASSVYASISSISPWLSREVVYEVYKRSDIYTQAQRGAILSQNPDNYLLVGFGNSLRGHSYSLSNEQLDQIEVGLNFNTARSLHEARMSYFSQEVAGICNEAIEYYKQYDTYNQDSIEAWINRLNSYGSLRELIDIQFEQGDITGANTEVTSLMNSSINNMQEADLETYQELIDLVESANISGRYIGSLSSSEVQYLNLVASNYEGISASEASSVMDFYYINSNQSLKKSDDQGVDNAESLLTVQLLANKLSFYPNPANDRFTVLISGDNIASHPYTIEFYDLYGKSVLRQTILFNSSELDISHIPSGVYKVVLYLEDQRISTNKLLIHH